MRCVRPAARLLREKKNAGESCLRILILLLLFLFWVLGRQLELRTPETFFEGFGLEIFVQRRNVAQIVQFFFAPKNEILCHWEVD